MRGDTTLPVHAWKIFTQVVHVTSRLIRLKYRRVVCTHWTFTFTQDYQMHQAEMLHQILPKGLVILNLKPSSRFSRALVMVSWVKHRSRSDITSRNIAALKWRTRQAIHKLKRGANWEGLVNSEFYFNGGFVHAKGVSKNCPLVLPI